MAIPIMFGVFFAALFILFLVAGAIQSYNAPLESFSEMSDREILLTIQNQIDGIITPEILAGSTILTKSEAKARLKRLNYRGLLKSSYSTKNFKAFYMLKQPIKEGPYPILSEHPFLSVSDLMILFKFYDYRLSLQDICMATGLPIVIIQKEMKYFIKKEIVQEIQNWTSDGMSLQGKFYILQSQYRTNPEAYIENEASIDLDLGKMYEKIQRKMDHGRNDL